MTTTFKRSVIIGVICITLTALFVPGFVSAYSGGWGTMPAFGHMGSYNDGRGHGYGHGCGDHGYFGGRGHLMNPGYFHRESINMQRNF